MDRIEFKEMVELFLIRVMPAIKEGKELPKINFDFGNDLAIFYDALNNSSSISGSDCEEKDIKLATRIDEDALTIKVRDSYKFFNLLKDITNASLELKNSSLSRSEAMDIGKRIWLRMGVEDVNNVEVFLEKELEFLKDRTFDTKKLGEVVDTFGDYKVTHNILVNSTWDESTRSMLYTIHGDGKSYDLPRVLYDIDSRGKCYIYGVQTAKSKDKDKSIERKLYKINKGIDNPNVHPSKIWSMIFFIKELKKKGIKEIEISGMQVLNYPYHELLSDQAKEQLACVIRKINMFPERDCFIEEYQETEKWYQHVHNNQDKISYLKTEELMNLVLRICDMDETMHITNELNIQGDSLKIKIKN